MMIMMKIHAELFTRTKTSVPQQNEYMLICCSHQGRDSRCSTSVRWGTIFIVGRGAAAKGAQVMRHADPSLHIALMPLTKVRFVG